MKLYKNGTGWKQPNKKTGTGWTYYEDYKIKPPGADAMRLLQIGLDKGKDLYKSVRDMPITKTIFDGFNEMAKYQGEAALLRGEVAVQQARTIEEVGDKITDGVEAIITETSKIPDKLLYHPSCLETFGELCTVNEYNKRMQQRVNESISEGWSTYIPGSGGID